MHDIDLIPTDYRDYLWKVRTATRLAIVAAVVAALGLAAWLALKQYNTSIRDEMRRLQNQQALTDQQRLTVENLRGQLDQLRQQKKLMDRLRSGSAAVEMFAAIDRAIEGRKVWFRKWGFRRAMEQVDQARVGLQQSSPDTGFFIVIPLGQAQPKYWEISNHMTIRGEASDHHELSRFVANLFAQPEIHEVKVLTASRRDYGEYTVVEFEIAIVVQPGLKKS